MHVWTSLLDDRTAAVAKKKWPKSNSNGKETGFRNGEGGGKVGVVPGAPLEAWPGARPCPTIASTGPTCSCKASTEDSTPYCVHDKAPAVQPRDGATGRPAVPRPKPDHSFHQLLLPYHMTWLRPACGSISSDDISPTRHTCT